MRFDSVLASVVGIGLAATACGDPDLSDQLSGYGQAIEAILAREPAPVDADDTRGMQLPTRRERRIDVPDHRMGGMDFLAIQGCRLSQLVGSRNGPMGRVMVPSRRLVYELEVLEAADECLEGLSDGRAARLGGTLAAKRAELPAHLWNAVWMGEEIEGYLSSMTGPMALLSSDDGQAGLDGAVAVLERPLESAQDALELEAALAELRSEHAFGPMLGSLHLVRRTLNRVADLLETSPPTGCRGDAVRLASAFETHYLRLQAPLATLDRRVHARLEALDRLFDASSAGVTGVPDAMSRYATEQLSPRHPTGAWARYREAVRRHAQAWEPTLVLCGVLPDAEAA